MAKLAELMEARARLKREGGEDRSLRCVKRFNVSLGCPVEVTDTDGRGKLVSILRCSAHIVGVPTPVDREIEIEAGEGFGVLGELDQISPKLGEFVAAVKAAFLTKDEDSREETTEKGAVADVPENSTKE